MIRPLCEVPISSYFCATRVSSNLSSSELLGPVIRPMMISLRRSIMGSRDTAEISQDRAAGTTQVKVSARHSHDV
jgi:hypothetical protein